MYKQTRGNSTEKWYISNACLMRNLFVPRYVLGTTKGQYNREFSKKVKNNKYNRKQIYNNTYL